jgi:hypothetical protein
MPVVSFYPMEMKVQSSFSNERLVIVIETSIIKKLLLMQNKLLFHSKLYVILNWLPSWQFSKPLLVMFLFYLGMFSKVCLLLCIHNLKTWHFTPYLVIVILTNIFILLMNLPTQFHGKTKYHLLFMSELNSRTC